MRQDHSKKRPDDKGKQDLHTVAGFAALYDEYAQKIWAHIFVRVRLREESNDLASQVFFKTWEYVKKGNAISNTKSFLYRTADNCIVDWYRSRKNIASDLSEEEREHHEPAYTERFDDALDESARARDVHRALGALSEKERSLLLMRFVEELEIPEISRITGKTPGAIAVALHRALKSLHRALETQ